MAIFVNDPPMRRGVRNVRLCLQRMVPNCCLIVGPVDVLLKSILGCGGGGGGGELTRISSL